MGLDAEGSKGSLGEIEMFDLSRRTIGESQLSFVRLQFPPLTTVDGVLSSCCDPGTIPPAIGNLVKLTRLDFASVMDGHRMDPVSGECERLCDHRSH